MLAGDIFPLVKLFLSLDSALRRHRFLLADSMLRRAFRYYVNGALKALHGVGM